MGEENLENLEDETFDQGIQYPLTISVRITRDMRSRLDIIAAYEATKPSTLARREILSMIRRYQRNPQFKRWLKDVKKVKDVI